MDNTRIEQIYHKNIDVVTRIIYFCPWQGELIPEEDREWEVNDYSIQNLLKGLYILEQNNKKKITIIWSSIGGDWDSGMAVYDYIESLKSPVTMICFGRVMSMGTIILQSCKTRILSKNCLFLMHYRRTGVDPMHDRDFQAFAKRSDQERFLMESIYLEKIKEKKKKFKREELRELMKYDKYMIPREAVDFGLADKIL